MDHIAVKNLKLTYQRKASEYGAFNFIRHIVRINVYKNIDIRINTYYNKDRKGGHTMPMTSKQMVKLLKQNGFIEIRQAGSHKILNNPVTNRSVVVPIHAKDLPKGTERNILKQAGLL